MKHGLLLIALLPLYAYSQEFKCDRQVNEKKAVVFINVNGGFLESQAAEKAACSRGELFIHIPAMTKEVKDFAEIYMKEQILGDQISRECYSSGKSIDTEQCLRLHKEHDPLTLKSLELKEKVPTVDQALITQELRTLADKSISTTSVIISGHNGGGAVSGNLGRVAKYEFMGAFDEAYKEKPELKKELQSSLMWGCYTSTPVEIMGWKERFPDMKIIAGFSGSGPNHLREANHRLMNDLLTKEKSILKEESMEAAQLAIQGLAGAGETFIGLYAQCGEKKDEFYASNLNLEPKFERFSEASKCAGSKPKILKLTEEFGKYYYGRTLIPEITSSGPLRDLYSQSRAYAHCIDPEELLNANRVGLLLFSTGVHKNFAQTFAKEIKAYQKECKNLGTLVTKQLFTAGYQETAKKSLEMICELLEGYSSTDVTPLSRQEISKAINWIQMVGFLDPEDDAIKAGVARRAKMPATANMKRIMSKYLYSLDPRCMDFDLWHEYKPGVIAKPKCL